MAFELREKEKKMQGKEGEGEEKEKKEKEEGGEERTALYGHQLPSH